MKNSLNITNQFWSSSRTEAVLSTCNPTSIEENNPTAGPLVLNWSSDGLQWVHQESYEHPHLYDSGYTVEFPHEFDRSGQVFEYPLEYSVSTPRISEVDDTVLEICASASTLTNVLRPRVTPVLTLAFQGLLQGDQSKFSAEIQNIISDYQDRIPERYDGELERDIVQLRDSSKNEAFVSFLGYVVYLSTNNFIRNDQIDSLLEWLMDDEHLPILSSFLNTKTATTEAFSHMLFRAALASCNRKAAEALLEGCFDLREFMYECGREVELAVKRDGIELVALLLKHGMDVNISILSRLDYNYCSSHPPQVLHAATSIEMIQLLVVEGGADINYSDCLGHGMRNRLQEASSAGRTDLVDKLIELGADIDRAALSCKSCGTTGTTALMAAVEGGHVETGRLLLEKGADPNQYSSFSTRTAFRLPRFPNRMGPNEFWHTESCPLQIAARNGNLELVKLILDHHADVNALNIWRLTSKSGILTKLSHDPIQSPGLYTTPLVEAVESGRLDVVQVLLDAGADVNKPVFGKFGVRAINAARGQPTLLQALCESGPVEVPHFDELDLQLAVWRGDLELVHELLQLGFNVNMASLHPSVGNILGMAVEQQKIALVQIILEHGADVNGKGCGLGSNGKLLLPDITPLQSALSLSNSNYVIVRILCEAGADVNARGTCERYFPLQLSLRYYPDPKWSERKKIGCAEKCISLANLLLSYGAQVNPNLNADNYRYLPSDYGTPLQLAIHPSAKLGSYDLPLKMLQLGADVNAIGNNGETALSTAVRCANVSDDFNFVRLLLRDWNADVNKTRGLTTPLECAIQRVARDITGGKQYIGLVQLLLDHGAHVNTRLGTALSSAVGSSLNLDLIGLLLDRGADVNAPYSQTRGESVLQELVSSPKCSVALVQRLLGAGADINAPPAKERGRTVLQAATSQSWCRVGLVQILLEKGADVNSPACPYAGLTALQGAAIQGNFKIVQLLLDHEADVNAPGSEVEGRTALEGASEHGRLDMVQFLLNAGADSHLPLGERYKSSIKYAEKEGHIAVANLLLSYSV